VPRQRAAVDSCSAETHYLRPVVTALRKKLVPQLIRTEPGVGYRLQPPH